MNPPIDRADIAKDWHARGYSCGLWIDHAGREWRNTILQTEELFMVMSGDLELEIGGQIIRPSVGKEIVISAGIAHSIRNIGGTTARWLYGQKREHSHSPEVIKEVRRRLQSHSLSTKEIPIETTVAPVT